MIKSTQQRGKIGGQGELMYTLNFVFKLKSSFSNILQKKKKKSHDNCIFFMIFNVKSCFAYILDKKKS